jgi:hypothetical protein
VKRYGADVSRTRAGIRRSKNIKSLQYLSSVAALHRSDASTKLLALGPIVARLLLLLPKFSFSGVGETLTIATTCRLLAAAITTRCGAVVFQTPQRLLHRISVWRFERMVIHFPDFPIMAQFAFEFDRAIECRAASPESGTYAREVELHN